MIPTDIFYDEETRCIHVHVVAGPKAFLRIWLDQVHGGAPINPEWGWVLPDSAKRIWTEVEGE